MWKYIKRRVSWLANLTICRGYHKYSFEQTALRRYLAKDRSSKLLGSQEAGLIKELEHAMPKVDGHYRPETVHYGYLASSLMLANREVKRWSSM